MISSVTILFINCMKQSAISNYKYFFIHKHSQPPHQQAKQTSLVKLNFASFSTTICLSHFCCTTWTSFWSPVRVQVLIFLYTQNMGEVFNSINHPVLCGPFITTSANAVCPLWCTNRPSSVFTELELLQWWEKLC